MMTRCSLVVVLLLGNVLVFPPFADDALVLFSPRLREVPIALDLEEGQGEGEFTVRVIHLGTVQRPRMGTWPPPSFPLDRLHQEVERLSAERLVRDAKLAIWIREPTVWGRHNPEMIREYERHELDIPQGVFDGRGRVMLKTSLTLPPGKHEVRAVLYADPPQGAGPRPNDPIDIVSPRMSQPIWSTKSIALFPSPSDWKEVEVAD